MDAERFDRFTRAVGAAVPRRRLLVAAMAAAVGGALGKRPSDTGAACTPLGQACSSAGQCCSGTCAGGVCGCPPGNEPCNGTTCTPVCPPDQVRGSGCRCLCRATGRPPGPLGCPCTASSVCDGGDIVFCGGTSLDCLCDRTAAGRLVCSDFFAAPEIPCARDADCPANHSCITSYDCAQPYCALACGAPSTARTANDPTWDRSQGPPK